METGFVNSLYIRVQVRPSGEAGGGEGLFAARDLEAGSVVSFYNGVRIRSEEQAEEWGDSGGYRSLSYRERFHKSKSKP